MSSRQRELVVLKVGGSLLDYPQLQLRLREIISGQKGLCLIVCGGGEMVNEIRRLESVHHWNTQFSHWTAISSMTITCRILAQILQVPVISSWSEIIAQQTDRLDRQTAVSVDVCGLDGISELPENWDVTSDSIAAWIAQKCGAAKLMLLKSKDLDAKESSISELITRGDVDPYFAHYSHSIPKVEWVNVRSDERLRFQNVLV